MLPATSSTTKHVIDYREPLGHYSHCAYMTGTLTDLTHAYAARG